MTLGIRRTRSVPQGDTCAADLFGAPLDIPAGNFMETCQRMKWGLPVGGGYLGLLLFADNCWLIGMSVAELQTMASEWHELLKQEDYTLVGMRQYGAPRRKTFCLVALQCRGQQ